MPTTDDLAAVLVERSEQCAPDRHTVLTVLDEYRALRARAQPLTSVLTRAHLGGVSTESWQLLQRSSPRSESGSALKHCLLPQ